MTYQGINKDFLRKIKNKEDVDGYKDDSRCTIMRLSNILNFLKEGGFKIENKSCMDYGCNNGFVSNYLALNGMNVIGIENDVIRTIGYVPESAINMALNIRGELDITNAQFYNRDLIDFYKEDKNTYDYSIFLSILHNLVIKHFQFGKTLTYGEATELFVDIYNRTNKVLFYENDDNYQQLQIEELCKHITGYKIVELCKTTAYNGGRKVYAIVKENQVEKKNLYNDELEVIHLSGTAKNYVVSNKEDMMEYFGFEDIFEGSLNLKVEKIYSIPCKLFNGQVSCSNKRYNFFECYINDVKAYGTFTNINVIEVWCDRKIDIKKGKVRFEIRER